MIHWPSEALIITAHAFFHKYRPISIGHRSIRAPECIDFYLWEECTFFVWWGWYNIQQRDEFTVDMCFTSKLMRDITACCTSSWFIATHQRWCNSSCLFFFAQENWHAVPQQYVQCQQTHCGLCQVCALYWIFCFRGELHPSFPAGLYICECVVVNVYSLTICARGQALHAGFPRPPLLLAMHVGLLPSICTRHMYDTRTYTVHQPEQHGAKHRAASKHKSEPSIYLQFCRHRPT